MISDIRSWYVSISHSVKLSYYCKLLNIKPANLTQFIKGYDKALSVEKLLKLKGAICCDLLQKIG